MAAIDADPQLLLSAFLRMVRRLFGTVAAQKEWVEQLQQHALIGTASSAKDALGELQGFMATTVGSDGTSTQWICAMPPATVASMCEAALQTIEADAAAGGVGLTNSGQVRGIAFDARACQMG